MESYEAKDDNQLLQNALLFNAIRKNKTTTEKLRKMNKYIDQGADVNAVDANNNNNTPLHVAILKGEIDIVIFLLGRGANATCKNANNETPLDIAQQAEAFVGQNIANILKSNIIQNRVNFPSQLKETSSVQQTQKQCNVENKHTNENMQLYYQKRSGTSALGGHLYGTKLVSLVLLRALHNDKISDFYLGTNLEAMGAFDDIVIKYKYEGIQKPRIIFLQVKHKEDPAKEKVTVDAILRPKGDFSLYKYFASYLKTIRHTFHDTDCEFIFFTSAMENFTKKKLIDRTEETELLENNRVGKKFKFEYDQQDVDTFVHVMSLVQAVALAGTLCEFILKSDKNYNNIMIGNLIKTFHVFLAQVVVVAESISLDQHGFYYLCKFRPTFLSSNDELLVCIRNFISNKIIEVNNSKLGCEKIDIQTLTFKLPFHFGNINFGLNDFKIETQTGIGYISSELRIDYLSSKLKMLLQNVNDVGSKYIIVTVDSSMIGPNNILQEMDLGLLGLAGLVGNLLILDEETKHLMFNLNLKNLHDTNIKIINQLRNWFGDLSRFRFVMKVYNFPKLTLASDTHDMDLVKEFFGKIKFYTNQPKEDEVENIIKEDIEILYCTQRTQNESILRIKCDTIFLKVHDRIQKWWQRSSLVPYLSKNCNFFDEAAKDILESPMLSFLNIIYHEHMKKINATFKPEAIDALKLDDFFKSGRRLIAITSDEVDYTSLKIIRYFEEKNLRHIFIDLDFALIENYFDDLLFELVKSKLLVLTIVCHGNRDTKKVDDKINIISKNFNGIIILISNKDLVENLTLTETFIKEADSKINFMDLSSEFREKVLAEQKITFQGESVLLGELFDHNSLHLVKGDILRKIITNDKIEIGHTLNNPSYSTIVNFYIYQRLCCYITIDIKSEQWNDFCIIDNDATAQVLPKGSEDIIFITNSEIEFEELSHKYKEHNVHWFICEGHKDLVGHKGHIWKKTHGSLETLLKYVTRGSRDYYEKRPKTLKDMTEKVCIINAEPGMGKSTFLTHLAIETKRMYPKLWISKINLLEHIDQFSKWKEDKTHINISEIIKFLLNGIIKDRNDGIMNTKNDWNDLITQLSNDFENKLSFINADAIQNIGLDLFELNLFIHLYNNNLVALLFDGFDEICPDYADQVLQMLSTLKNSKVAHLWVTSRSYNVLHQLECVLGTFSYALQALTKFEQVIFLRKIWTSQLGLSNSNKTRVLVNSFYQTISFALRDNENSFTSLPLHLYMVSEIFQDFFRYYYDPTIKKFSNIYMQQVMKSFNLINLYETFVDMKFFKIRFGEKKHFLCFKDPHLRKMVQNERKEFLENHKKVSAYFLLAKSVVTDLFSEQELREVHEFIENIKSGEEKSGIIERMVGDDPKFVHVTFAEYFATEFLFDKFQSGSCTIALQKYIINVIFLTDAGGVRRFINSKLIKDKKLFDLSTRKSYVCSVFGALVTQNFLPTNSFFLASEEYLNHVAMFMLICVSTAHTARNGVKHYMQLFKAKCMDSGCDLCTFMKYKFVKESLIYTRRMQIRTVW